MRLPFSPPGPFYGRRQAEWFYRLLGLAVLALVLLEIYNGQWYVHRGDYCPRRFRIGGLYPTGVLAVEWVVSAASALALAAGWRRGLFVRIASLISWVSLWQRYANQKALLALILSYLALSPPRPEREDFERTPLPVLELVQYQVLLVYIFSALNKIKMGFLDGESLRALFANVAQMPRGPWIPARIFSGFFERWSFMPRGLSWAILFGELAVPAALLAWPRLGLAGLVALHLAFSLCLPDLWTFSLTMAAGGVLFLTAPAPGSR